MIYDLERSDDEEEETIIVEPAGEEGVAVATTTATGGAGPAGEGEGWGGAKLVSSANSITTMVKAEVPKAGGGVGNKGNINSTAVRNMELVEVAGSVQAGAAPGFVQGWQGQGAVTQQLKKKPKDSDGGNATKVDEERAGKDMVEGTGGREGSHGTQLLQGAEDGGRQLVGDNLKVGACTAVRIFSI